MEPIKQSVIQLRIELKKFDSIEEIMAYPLMKERVGHHVHELWKSRVNRPTPPAGMRYVKDTVDVMIDQNELTTSFMMKHYADVHNKVSSIPGVRRHIMTHVCSSAINDVLKSCTVALKQGDKLNVKEQRAKLTIIYIDQEKREITVMFKKLKETWTINKFVNDVLDGELYL